MKDLVKKWFQCWGEGDYLNIPVAEDFKHTSPYGTIDGKTPYLELVEANNEKFFKYHKRIKIYGSL